MRRTTEVSTGQLLSSLRSPSHGGVEAASQRAHDASTLLLVQEAVEPATMRQGASCERGKQSKENGAHVYRWSPTEPKDGSGTST